jgi:hypothetical protein
MLPSAAEKKSRKRSKNESGWPGRPRVAIVVYHTLSFSAQYLLQSTLGAENKGGGVGERGRGLG